MVPSRGWKKGMTLAVVSSLLVATANGAFAQQAGPAAPGTTGPAASAPAVAGSLTEMLGQVEVTLYGKAQVGSIIERLDRIERDLYGKTETGALVVRIQRAAGYLAQSGVQGASLKLKLNAAEWMLFQRLSEGQPLVQRLDGIETGVYGTPRSGSLVERIESLVQLVWPSGRLDVASVEIPRSTLVKIELRTPLNSATDVVGKPVEYRVVQDVVINNRVVIPAGSTGWGQVSAVERAGRLGKDGYVRVDFRSVPAIDGSGVPVEMGEKAFQTNRSSVDGAAAASMAGVLLLGPIGLIGGYFVQGQDTSVAAGTQFFVEVSRPTQVFGLSLAPAVAQ